MPISDRTRKLLWGRAATRCSICRKYLVVDPNLAEGESLIGEECHIVAQTSGGPRWDPAYPIEHIDSYNNLIVLCRNHHKEVDDLPEIYPIQDLILIKHRHELWVRITLNVDGGAFPSPTSDILLSRFSLPAVFGLLADAVLCACKGVLAASRTFDRDRRELQLAARLQKRLRGLVSLLAAGDTDCRRTLNDFLEHSLGWFLAEAEYILPSEDETRVTRSTERYRDAYHQATAQWDAIRESLLSDAVILHEYHELSISEERWPLLGFMSAEEAREWLEPTTKTLFDTLGAFELEFLRELTGEGEVDIEALASRGMPRGIIIDLFNRLARDKWATLEDGRIRATPLSRKFITAQLAMQGDPV